MKTLIIGLVVCLYGSFNAVAQEPVPVKKEIVVTQHFKHSRVNTSTRQKVDYTKKQKITTTRKIEAIPVEELKTK